MTLSYLPEHAENALLAAKEATEMLFQTVKAVESQALSISLIQPSV